MNPEEEKLFQIVSFVKERIPFTPKLALVLGSGLGQYAESALDTKYILPYTEIPSFPVSTVSGHRGCFLFGFVQGVPVVCMQGRVHYYEGYSMTDVVLPIRLMGLLGAKCLVLTNAAGGIKEGICAGDLMMITGHISSFVPSPLQGANFDRLGTRFPDMSEVYSKQLQEKIRTCAKACDIPLKEGVYLQASGPNYETPEEIQMFRTLGADAVGMSTACEAMAAKHMGLKVCGISCISNMAAGLGAGVLSHEEVGIVAKTAEPRFHRLMNAILKEIGAEYY